VERVPHECSKGKNLRIKRAKGRNMKILRTTAAAVISSFLMGGACVPAWSATPMSEGLTVAQTNSANTTVQPAITVLGSPEFPRFDSRPDAEKNCYKPGQMYSAHDVVGDPQTCIMGRFSGFGGAAAAAVPVL
jgi:hypothetical protein